MPNAVIIDPARMAVGWGLQGQETLCFAETDLVGKTIMHDKIGVDRNTAFVKRITITFLTVFREGETLSDHRSWQCACGQDRADATLLDRRHPYRRYLAKRAVYLC